MRPITIIDKLGGIRNARELEIALSYAAKDPQAAVVLMQGTSPWILQAIAALAHDRLWLLAHEMETGTLHKESEMDTPKTKQQYSNHVKKEKVQNGHLLRLTHYLWVMEKISDDVLMVRDVETGVEMKIDGGPLIERMQSGDQFHEEIKVSMTQCIRKLTSSIDKVVSVCFDKKDGTERVMRGRVLGADEDWGNTFMHDYEVPLDDPRGRIREVNHRTLKWLIVDGVKFIVK